MVTALLLPRDLAGLGQDARVRSRFTGYLRRHPVLAAVLFCGLLLAVGGLDIGRVRRAKDLMSHAAWMGGLRNGLMAGSAGLIGAGIAFRFKKRRIARLFLGGLAIVVLVLFAWVHPKYGDYLIDSPTKVSILVAGDLPVVVGLPALFVAVVSSPRLRRRVAGHSALGRREAREK